MTLQFFNGTGWPVALCLTLTIVNCTGQTDTSEETTAELRPEVEDSGSAVISARNHVLTIDSIAAFKDAFNSERGHPRFVTILSPT